ncbi:hypothetical protein GCK72_020163 [Caenorhabditis remanei]|uniref:Uncharacterized protein n=1 Tax=Caenorhabditis remanei TaxID=31234 RepID=A0A6A5GFX2_CAERE|nr:hypothetical protein GCK72_020163 [Caenorhabditis remanei]KAF1753606.1 hypothetical protein GCK72_020163 [Caenorhabditis remanei]
MEIDGGPPPFIGAVDKNPHEDELEEDVYEDESLDSSHLPLPPDANRSRSVTPDRSLNSDSIDVTQVSSSASPPNVLDDNDKGDTVKTAISQNDCPEFQTTSDKEDVSQKENDDDDEWGDFGEVVSAAPIQNFHVIKNSENFTRKIFHVFMNFAVKSRLLLPPVKNRFVEKFGLFIQYNVINKVSSMSMSN